MVGASKCRTGVKSFCVECKSIFAKFYFLWAMYYWVRTMTANKEKGLTIFTVTP
jgi:hypothetical protein